MTAPVARRERLEFGLHELASPSQPPPEHDPEKWEPVFGKRSCSNKELKRDDDSKKNHPALTCNDRGPLRFGALFGWSLLSTQIECAVDQTDMTIGLRKI